MIVKIAVVQKMLNEIELTMESDRRIAFLLSTCWKTNILIASGVSQVEGKSYISVRGQCNGIQHVDTFDSTP